ncbi:putative Vegetative incompatibility protein HET-E-1 [Glarea lozoyensis 74030]|uniref:Putative Vegetative incompatibility protein HET-E-1 n=1 Tax=Glarea lozoyensis (strain ATCC 74030 / MF5533) TaxID=1104152 RepID=H0EP53_GLAL7|nr:putative Vegetative incompatibility protein HET-E-1 [Glarea lozoyensis 74030]
MRPGRKISSCNIDILSSLSITWKRLREVSGLHEVGLSKNYWHHRIVAQKFSWAARRKTTREEDKSYSLMGLLSINMPILYGEGQRAFMRFQEEVLRTSADESIFAWAPEWYQQYAITSLLAPSIAHFDTCGNIITKKLPTEFNRREPYAMTNKGLRMEHRILYPDWVHAHRVLSSTLSRNVLNVVSMTTIKPDQILVKPFEELVAVADIVELNSLENESYVMGLVEISSPEKVPKRAQDRKSRRLVNGDIVTWTSK